jgi:uncharacterized protein (DUF2132 family)
MTNNQPQNPLHGITLEMILTQLAAQYSWEELGQRIPIKCFTDNPSIKSSLKFLRRTPWARKKVEELYNTHGHKLRFPPSEKAQFVTECGIHKVYSMTFPTKKNLPLSGTILIPHTHPASPQADSACFDIFCA